MESIDNEVMATAEANQSNDNEVLAAELTFELFKQYARLSSAILGAVVVLVQLKAIEMNSDVFFPVGFLALSILLSFLGKDLVADSVLKKKTVFEISMQITCMRLAALFSMGIGNGHLASSFLW